MCLGPKTNNDDTSWPPFQKPWICVQSCVGGYGRVDGGREKANFTRVGGGDGSPKKRKPKITYSDCFEQESQQSSD